MLTCLCQRTQNSGSVFCVFAFVVQVLAIDCFGTNLTHAQTCDNVPVPRATPWTASVHTQRMPKPVITFVFKVLRNGLLRYKLDTWLFSANSFQRLNTKKHRFVTTAFGPPGCLCLYYDHIECFVLFCFYAPM